jgi:hypothetical protein
MSSVEQALAARLQALGARVRRRKDGSLHTVEMSAAPQAATDALLAELEGAPRIKVLALPGAPITDDAAGSLAQLTQLTELDLRNTALTDEGLLQLKLLSGLTLLQLTGSRVTREGVKTLRQSLLNCRVVFLD